MHGRDGHAVEFAQLDLQRHVVDAEVLLQSLAGCIDESVMAVQGAADNVRISAISSESGDQMRT